jgi:hypothetical protein
LARLHPSLAAGRQHTGGPQHLSVPARTGIAVAVFGPGGRIAAALNAIVPRTEANIPFTVPALLTAARHFPRPRCGQPAHGNRAVLVVCRLNSDLPSCGVDGSGWGLEDDGWAAG